MSKRLIPDGAGKEDALDRMIWILEDRFPRKPGESKIDHVVRLNKMIRDASLRQGSAPEQ